MSIDVLVQESSDRSRSMAYSLPYGWVVHVLLLVTAADAAAWRWAPPTRRGPPMEKFGAGAPARPDQPPPATYEKQSSGGARWSARFPLSLVAVGVAAVRSGPGWVPCGYPSTSTRRPGGRRREEQLVPRPRKPRPKRGNANSGRERERWTPARGGTTPSEGGGRRLGERASSRFLFLCKARRHRGGRGRALVVTIHCGMDPNSPPHL
jgi:hypothetical protein